MSYKYTIPKYKNNINNSKPKFNNSKSNNTKSNNFQLFKNTSNKSINNSGTKNLINKAKKFKSDLINISDKTKTKVSNFNFNWKHIIMIILIIVIIGLILFILNYLLSDCDNKKFLGEYILDGTFEPCKTKAHETTTYTERIEKDEEEVYHLANQDYTYKQAKCKCAAYGGRLASKDEIVKAYNNGAEWCSYGWSDGQNAYYPTQKCTWDKLQEGAPEHRLDCGMPGINGGFFSNPKLKFGANCYGVKPKGELVQEKPPVCSGKEFCDMRQNTFASNKLDTDEIASFNDKQWSRFD